MNFQTHVYTINREIKVIDFFHKIQNLYLLATNQLEQNFIKQLLFIINFKRPLLFLDLSNALQLIPAKQNKDNGNRKTGIKKKTWTANCFRLDFIDIK